MKIIVFISYFILTSCSSEDISISSHKVSALETLNSFYKEYLSHNPNVKDLKFSRSFKSLSDLNHELCLKKLPKIKCGWRVDGDLYLNAQEYDLNLTYKKSGIKLREPKKGTVVVNLNVFPEHGKSYDREIVYKLIEENDQWVLDDIISPKDKSLREYILNENQWLKN